MSSDSKIGTVVRERLSPSVLGHPGESPPAVYTYIELRTLERNIVFRQLTRLAGTWRQLVVVAT